MVLRLWSSGISIYDAELIIKLLVLKGLLFQTLESTQRRRDIYQALTTNMGEIFTFFLRLISEHFHALKDLREQGQEAELNVHVRVVQVVLLTLTGFIEWVSINHVMANNGQLLQILCLLLDDEDFQAQAAECLLQVVTYHLSSIF
jgi:exportin-5